MNQNRGANRRPMCNLLTFDIEDWFHILELREHEPTRVEWDSFPSRLEQNVGRILELLNEFEVHATFFVLGWVAEKYRTLVKAIDSAGHEVGCHGYGHDLVSRMTPDGFRTDLRQAKTAIQDLTGKKIKGYRGPGFSITEGNLWAFDIIAEEGFEYDATLYPGVHGHGGMPGLPTAPFRLVTPSGHAIDEFPVSVVGLGTHRIAFSGGGYFRLCPLWLLTWLVSFHNKRDKSIMMYLHPRDLDPATPRLPMKWTRRFRCYVNLSGAYRKLEYLLKHHSFCSISDWRVDYGQALSTYSLKESILEPTNILP